MENEAKEIVLSTSTLVSCCLNFLFWFVFILLDQLSASQPLQAQLLCRDSPAIKGHKLIRDDPSPLPHTL